MNDAENKIIMQGIHVELTDAMKIAIQEKFGGLLELNSRIIRINVRLQSDQKLGHKHLYHGTAQIEIGGPDLVASAEGKDAYGVLDELVDRLSRLLERRHGKRKDRRNHPHEPELASSIPKAEIPSEASQSADGTET